MTNVARIVRELLVAASVVERLQREWFVGGGDAGALTGRIGRGAGARAC